jgi:MFS family permease
MILGLLAYWLFAGTIFNIAPTMAADLGLQTSLMNIAVPITALFSGIFVVVMGGLADRIGRVKIVQWGFVLGIVGSLMVGLAPSGALASPFLILGRMSSEPAKASVPSTWSSRRVPTWCSWTWACPTWTATACSSGFASSRTCRS